MLLTEHTQGAAVGVLACWVKEETARAVRVVPAVLGAAVCTVVAVLVEQTAKTAALLTV